MRSYDKPLTVGAFKKWLEINNIADDTPLGIYLGDSEKADFVYGIIGDTVEQEIDEESYGPILHELSGRHCYCKGCHPLGQPDQDYDFVVMLTDGCHSE